MKAQKTIPDASSAGDVRKRIEELEAHTITLGNFLKAKERENEALQTKLNNASSDLEGYIERVRASSDEASGLRKRNRKLRKEYADLREKFRDIEGYRETKDIPQSLPRSINYSLEGRVNRTTHSVGETSEARNTKYDEELRWGSGDAG